MLYGLIGKRLGHSFSASYFAKKFHREGLNCEYRNFEIPEIEALPCLLGCEPDLRGFNVTIPYKEAIIPYLDSLTDEAREVGAVNTVRIDGGRLIGHNTDLAGFDCSLSELLGGERPKSALVLGTGGASKAVCAALRRRGIRHYIISRTRGMRYCDLTPEFVRDTLLIINTTPLGMWPDVDSKPELPYEAIRESHRCFDLVYNPAETAFMAEACRHGARVCNGLKMLHIQAEIAWNFWKEISSEN